MNACLDSIGINEYNKPMLEAEEFKKCSVSLTHALSHGIYYLFMIRIIVLHNIWHALYRYRTSNSRRLTYIYCPHKTTQSADTSPGI